MLIGSVMPKRWIGVPQRHGCRYLNVLRQPADTLTVTLSHDNTAHEDLDGTNALERNLALAGSLVETKLVSLFSALVGVPCRLAVKGNLRAGPH